VHSCRTSGSLKELSKHGGSIDFKHQPKKPEKTRGRASIIPVLFHAFGATFFFGAFLKLCQDLLTFASPQILK
jgi:hypothetical protein